MRVIAAGATGFIGTPLVAALVSHGHQVQVLSRKTDRPIAGASVLTWNPRERNGPWVEAIRSADSVINLAGESIAEGRWTNAKKQRIVSSRLESTNAVVDALAGAPEPSSKVLINASAIGYYGDAGDRLLPETSGPGVDFLADVCVQWEAGARRAESAGVRVVLPRIGIVLGPNGGALKPLLRLFRLGAGGPLGNGRQWWSWVHRDDVIGLVLHALETPVAGPLNVVSPNPIRMGNFAKALGGELHRPSFLPAPGFALRLALGEMADSLLLGSQRVVPEATLASGYTFRHPNLVPALRAILAA